MSGNTIAIEELNGVTPANVFNPFVEEYWKMSDAKDTRWFLDVEGLWEEMTDFDINWFNDIEEEKLCAVYTYSTNLEQDNNRHLIYKKDIIIINYDNLIIQSPEYGV